MTDSTRHSGNNDWENIDPTGELRREAFMAELMIAAEDKLDEALMRDQVDPLTFWTRNREDEETGFSLTWFRLSESQQFSRKNDDTFEIGFPTIELSGNLQSALSLEENVGQFVMRAAEQGRTRYIIARLLEQEEVRINSENITELTSDDSQYSFLVGLTDKLKTYYLHPISTGMTKPQN